jgi:hypothetical protein
MIFDCGEGVGQPADSVGLLILWLVSIIIGIIFIIVHAVASHYAVATSFTSISTAAAC